MNIEDALSREHSKKISLEIVNYIMIHPDATDQLMKCFFEKNLRICQRAAWPLGILGQQSPDLLLPYLDQMIKNLNDPPHDAVIRNTVRTWQYMDIPEAYQGEIFDICFNYIANPKMASAIRAFSMTVCENIAKEIPELKEELHLAINDILDHASSGVKSRAKKVLKTKGMPD